MDIIENWNIELENWPSFVDHNQKKKKIHTAATRARNLIFVIFLVHSVVANHSVRLNFLVFILLSISSEPHSELFRIVKISIGFGIAMDYNITSIFKIDCFRDVEHTYRIGACWSWCERIVWQGWCTVAGGDRKGKMNIFLFFFSLLVGFLLCKGSDDTVAVSIWIGFVH